MIALRPDREEVQERVSLALELLRVVLGRAPTRAEVLAHLSDADVDSLTDDETEDHPVGVRRAQ